MNDPVTGASVANTLETRTIAVPGNPHRRSARDSFWRLARFPLWAVFPIYASYFALLRRLPDTHAYRLGRLGYPQALWLLRRQRMANFHKVFAGCGWSESDFRRLNTSCLDFQRTLAIELARLLRRWPHDLRSGVSLIGEEHLKAALQAGKGAMVIGGHLGNWFYHTTLPASLGYPVSHVANEIPFPPLERDLANMRKRFGLKTIHLGQGGSRLAAEAFERNEIFATLIDLCNRPRHGIEVPFGPASLTVDIGPARLALKHQVPVLLAVSHGLGLDRAQVRLVPAAQFSDLASRAPAPEELMRLWIAQLFQEVANCPEQWWTWSFTRLRNSAPAAAPALWTTECG
jgi:KDO2-lipid IV(A) lauroyltransferase